MRTTIAIAVMRRSQNPSATVKFTPVRPLRRKAFSIHQPSFGQISRLDIESHAAAAVASIDHSAIATAAQARNTVENGSAVVFASCTEPYNSAISASHRLNGVILYTENLWRVYAISVHDIENLVEFFHEHVSVLQREVVQELGLLHLLVAPVYWTFDFDKLASL
jgi:hypothetical protein